MQALITESWGEEDLHIEHMFYIEYKITSFEVAFIYSGKMPLFMLVLNTLLYLSPFKVISSYVLYNLSFIIYSSQCAPRGHLKGDTEKVISLLCI